MVVTSSLGRSPRRSSGIIGMQKKLTFGDLSLGLGALVSQKLCWVTDSKAFCLDDVGGRESQKAGI